MGKSQYSATNQHDIPSSPAQRPTNKVSQNEKKNKREFNKE